MEQKSIVEQFMEIKKRRLARLQLQNNQSDQTATVSHQASAKCEFKSECYYKQKYGVQGFNKPKRVPNHPTKSHMVVAKYKEGNNYVIKVIYFGQKGVRGEGKSKSSDSEKQKNRRTSFKKRHAQNIQKGPKSAAYWANKVKW